MAQNYDYLFKIVVIGASDVGKTNLVKQFTKNEFEVNKKPTVIEFYEKLVNSNNAVVKSQIWDIGGQQTSIRHFYRGAWGFIVVYSVDNRDSFEKAKFYIDDIKKSVMNQPQFGRSQVAIMLVANKSDLANSARQVSTSEGKELAEKENLLFVETSAMNKKEEVASQIFEKTISMIFKTTSFEKAYPGSLGSSGNVDLDSSISITPVIPRKKEKPPPPSNSNLVEIKEVDSPPGTPMPKSTEDLTAENVFGALMRSVFHTLGKLSFKWSCSAPNETQGLGTNILLLFPRLLTFSILFIAHYLFLFFIILPFSFWYLALRRLKMISKSVIYEEQSLCVNWVAMLARSTPIFVFLFFIPIVLIYIIMYLHDPRDPRGTSDLVYGTLGLEMLVLFIIIVVGVIRREQAIKLMGKTQIPPAEYTQGFNWRNSRNILFIIIVLFELVQMVTWPLQQYNTSTKDIITHNNLDWLTRDIFPAFFWTFPYTSWKSSVTLSILIPFGMIGFLTLQFMQDTRMFFSLVKAGKFDEAVDYYSHSFVGGSTYGIGHLKFANRWVCGFMLLVGEGSFMATVNQLLASVTCSKETGAWLVSPDIQCWGRLHAGIATASLIALGFYLFISIFIAPMFIQCGQAANDIRYSELYLRLIMVFKLAMLIFATFYSLRSQSSLIASTLVLSWIVLTINFLWALYPDSDLYLVQPCTIPFINMLKLAIYLTSFWAAAIAMATTVAFPEATQETKFSLVVAGLVIDFVTLMICWCVYRGGYARKRSFSQVSFELR